MSQPNKGSNTLTIVLVVIGGFMMIAVGTCTVGAFWLKREATKAIEQGGLTTEAPAEVRAALAGDKRDYVGTWKSAGGSKCTIDANGTIDFALAETGKSRESMAGPIATLAPDAIEMKVFILIRIPIDSPPKKTATGYEMTLKGVRFERQ